jgi:hypothetical protein
MKLITNETYKNEKKKLSTQYDENLQKEDLNEKSFNQGRLLKQIISFCLKKTLLLKRKVFF